MKQYDIAVAGEIYVDHILAGFTQWPQPGEEVFTQEYMQEAGGGAAITACALARLGRSVSLIGAVGATELPWLEGRLSSFGVSSSHLSSGDGRTGVTISVSSKVDRLFFTYVGENARLEEQLADPAVLQHLTEARHVHFATPLTVWLADSLLPRLHAAGCTTSLDVGHQVAWLNDSANLRTCAAVHYLLPNEREAKLICDGDAEAYLNFTCMNHWPNGIVKLGAQGAAMRIGDKIVRVGSPQVQAVDTTGAGDAFDAGFIDGLLDDAVGEECMRRGCVCGGLSTRAVGALQGLSTRDEMRKCYEVNYG
jgi:sugar/nucleoside kinase (ribokinase family)